MDYRFFIIESKILQKEADLYFNDFMTTESIRNGLFTEIEIGQYIEQKGEVVAVSFISEPLIGWKEAPHIQPGYYEPDVTCDEGLVAKDILKAMTRPSFEPFRTAINSHAVHESDQVYFASLNRLGDQWIVNVPVDPANIYIPVLGLRELTAGELSLIRNTPNNAAIN